MKYVLLSIMSIVLCGCIKKAPVITQENVLEVLTRYAAENPENEVILESSLGRMRLKLYAETPLHRANFIKLIKDGYYDDAEFYRVVNEFMIQGGDLQKQLNYRIPAEFNKKYIHKRGALSMARVEDNNPNKESAAAEFFIIHGSRYNQQDLEDEMRYFGLQLTAEQKQIYQQLGGSMDLDQKYTVFGEVIEGMEVIEQIAKQQLPGTERPAKKIPFTIRIRETPTP